MSRFLNAEYKQLQAYTPGEQPHNKKLIKLNTNENPYEPSPTVSQAISEAEITQFRLYPDPDATQLLTEIAAYYNVEPGQVMVGNGSDEILAFCFMIFQGSGKKVYYPSPSYGFYPVYGDVFQAKRNPIPLTEDFTICIEDYKNLDGTIIIANPNAPTGIALEPQEIEEILLANQSNLVIIDEAYIDFGAKSCVPFVQKYDNLLVVQTFSKSRSLAGARVGFAIGSKPVIADLNKIKFSFNPYNINRLSILAASAAMKDRDYFRETCRKIVNTRQRLVKQMKAMKFHILPSKANFLFVRHDNISGKHYFERLRENNILVRHFDRQPTSDFVRITIGKDEEMDALLEATARILGEMEDRR